MAALGLRPPISESGFLTSTPRSLITRLHLPIQWHSGKVRCQGPPLAGWQGAKQPCGGHISGRGGADGMVDGGVLSYRLAKSGMDSVFRPSYTRPGG